MAFITAQEVAVKRKAIKTLYPVKLGFKFSVTKEHSSTVHIRLMEYPNTLIFPKSHADFNHYWADDGCSNIGPYEENLIRDMIAVASAGHWDESDIMTDYFNCAFYYYVGVGKWDKPAVSKQI